jgi:hypothetical protein
MRSHKVLVRSMVLLLALTAAGDLHALETEVAVLDPTADAATGARWASSHDVSSSDYRLSLGRGSLELGIRLEARAAGVRVPDSRLDGGLPGAPLVADLPSFSIGLRSTAIKSNAVPSSLVDRAFGNGGGETVVRKVGIAWKPAQSRVFLNQGVGIRFDGDDRLTVRLKKGSFGLYMQSTF